MKKTFLLLIAIALILEVVADILFKKWALQGSRIVFGIGLFAYIVGTVIWAYSLKFEGLSKAIVLFAVLNLILVVLAGIFVFKENLSVANKAGIVLGIASVVLLQL